MTDRKTYMREYMRRKRASKRLRTAPEATKPVNTSPDASGPKRVNKAHSWADGESLWVHPDGKVRNYPPEAALPRDVLDWRDP
jgi:hypothetical protein